MGELGGATPPKFNSSPLRINGWKITFLLGWPIFRGELLNFQGVPGFHNKNGSLLGCCLTARQHVTLAVIFSFGISRP